MLDVKTIEDLIANQIHEEINRIVQRTVSDTDWTEILEHNIRQHVQDRITARFSNIATVPDLVDTVKQSVKELFQQGKIPGLGSFVDQNVIKITIDSAIQDLVSKSIDGLVADQNWLDKMQTQIDAHAAKKFSEHLSTVDFNRLILHHIDEGIERWQEKLKKNFSSTGIKDTATKPELQVIPDGVVIENNLVTSQLVVGQDASVHGCLLVKDLAVTGSVNVDNESWQELSTSVFQRTMETITQEWKSQLVDQVLDLAKSQGIVFDDVLIKGESLIVDGCRLNKSIRESNIESVGTLKFLKVAGDSNLNDTFHVVKHRVGVNTDRPESTLSVWDEEVAIGLGKFSQHHAFIGTTRDQKISFGTNKIPHLDIDTNGLVTIKKLRVGRHRIGFESQVPGYSGTRGDIVFNSDPNPDTPFAWVCLGSFQWQPLKAMKS